MGRISGFYRFRACNFPILLFFCIYKMVSGRMAHFHRATEWTWGHIDFFQNFDMINPEATEYFV